MNSPEQLSTRDAGFIKFPFFRAYREEKARRQADIDRLPRRYDAWDIAMLPENLNNLWLEQLGYDEAPITIQALFPSTIDSFRLADDKPYRILKSLWTDIDRAVKNNNSKLTSEMSGILEQVLPSSTELYPTGMPWIDILTTLQDQAYQQLLSENQVQAA